MAEISGKGLSVHGLPLSCRAVCTAPELVQYTHKAKNCPHPLMHCAGLARAPCSSASSCPRVPSIASMGRLRKLRNAVVSGKVLRHSCIGHISALQQRPSR